MIIECFSILMNYSYKNEYNSKLNFIYEYYLS